MARNQGVRVNQRERENDRTKKTTDEIFGSDEFIQKLEAYRKLGNNPTALSASRDDLLSFFNNELTGSVRPKPLANPNLSYLTTICEGILDHAEVRNELLFNSAKTQVFETVLASLYGRNIHEWIQENLFAPLPFDPSGSVSGSFDL